MSEDAWEEWGTVPEAARRLGIGERKAYRHAAKLSDSDVRLSDSGRRLVRHSAMTCLTEGRERQTGAGGGPPVGEPLAAVSLSEPEVRPSDTAPQVSDTSGHGRGGVSGGVSDTLTDSGARVSDTGAPEVERLRKDLARVEDENRFMREQLALAMSGWREEQRRSRDYEKRMKELGPPRAEGEGPEEQTSAAPLSQAPGPAPEDTERGATGNPDTVTPPEGAEGQKVASGWWARLWGGKGG